MCLSPGRKPRPHGLDTRGAEFSLMVSAVCWVLLPTVWVQRAGFQPCVINSLHRNCRRISEGCVRKGLAVKGVYDQAGPSELAKLADPV